jgi:hypothetical protein
MVIIVAVSVIFVLGNFSMRAEKRQALGNDLQFEYISRYSVGVKHLATGMGFSLGSPLQLSMQVRSEAVSPENQLEAIAVVGELEGSDAAAKSADTFLSQNPPTDLVADARLMRTIYDKGSDAISSADKQGLEARHGWFGKLAVAHDAPENDPLRLAVVSAAKRTVFTALVFLCLIGVLLLTGLVLLIIFIVKFFCGTLPPIFRPSEPRIADKLVEGLAVWICTFLAFQFLGALLPAQKSMAWNLLILLPFAATLLWLHWRGITWSQLGQAVGWNRGRGIFREMGAGITGYIAGIPILVGAAIVTIILVAVSHTSPAHPIGKQILEPGWPRLLLFFLACVFAPITEEFLFRGLLLGHLRSRHGWILSALIVSFIFAAIHPQGWAAIPVLGAIAMTLASLREQRGSLIASMTAHALNNFVVLLMAVFALG